MIVCQNPGDGDMDLQEEVGNSSVVVVLFANVVVTHENDEAVIFISDSMKRPA
jgi:hypothetical protein